MNTKKYIIFNINYIYFRGYEDGVNLLCRVYDPKLNVVQDKIDSKKWDLLLNVRRIC